MSAIIDFPAGMTRTIVTGSLSSLGKAREGYVVVTAERKFGYINTDWIMDKVSEPIWLRSGRFAVEIPHSDQYGLIGDNGAPVTGIGYQIKFQPAQSEPAEVLAWTQILTVTGDPVPGRPGITTVAFSKLGNLGGWPHAVIITNPTTPTDPGGGETDIQLVEKSPGVWGLPTTTGGTL